MAGVMRHGSCSPLFGRQNRREWQRPTRTCSCNECNWRQQYAQLAAQQLGMLPPSSHPTAASRTRQEPVGHVGAARLEQQGGAVQELGELGHGQQHACETECERGTSMRRPSHDVCATNQAGGQLHRGCTDPPPNATINRAPVCSRPCTQAGGADCSLISTTAYGK